MKEDAPLPLVLLNIFPQQYPLDAGPAGPVARGVESDAEFYARFAHEGPEAGRAQIRG